MKSGKAHIKDAKFFVEYADLAIDNIKVSFGKWSSWKPDNIDPAQR